MAGIKSNMKFIKYSLFLCLILFSLTPCSVKEVFTNSFDVNYEKPLNKNRTTSNNSDCQFSTVSNREISVSQKKLINKNKEATSFLVGNNFDTKENFSEEFPEKYAGNSPPKYILYKRWKVDVA